MEIPILQGREFTDRDTRDSTPVIVLSESMAREMFPNQNPLGKRVRSWRDENLYREIVGVVGDLRYYGLTEKLQNNVYVPHGQNAWGTMVMAIRTAGDPSALAKSVQNAIWSDDKKLTIISVTSMDRILEREFAQPRFSMFLLAVLGATALVLAAVGIYGVIAYDVAQRTREIGIRIALGAARTNVLSMVARNTLWMAGAGAVCGIAGALSLTRLMQTLLYEVSPRDTQTFGIAAAVLLFIALASGVIPALRAARVDPAITLRCG